ncbi:MAG: hypothetical protein IT304_09460 [Dehalococcoidia bacterium]|nr:hypothetical protein [Dehalococcoidia bacterium]
MRLRSVVRVGEGRASLEDALASAADAVVLSLANAQVPVADLREAAREAVPRIREAGKLPFAVVNHPKTRLLRDDAEAIVLPGLAAVFLPHVTEPQDLRDLAVVLREFEHGRGIEPGTVRVVATVDSARGVLRAAEIAHAVPRMLALNFDAQGYALDVAGRPEESGPRLAFARGAVVAAARAFDLVPLIQGGTIDLLGMAQAGFGGALLPTPALALQANAAFSPSAEAVERARAQVAAYEAARAEGATVARLGEEVVDGHTVRKARQLLG